MIFECNMYNKNFYCFATIVSGFSEFGCSNDNDQ